MSVINQIQVGSTTYDIQDAAAVPSSRTVNGKALSSNITLSASDVGAMPSTYTAPVTSVNGNTGAVVLAIPSKASDVNALENSTNNAKMAAGVNLYMQYVDGTQKYGWTLATATPSQYCVAKYAASSYLNSATPGSTDNSTKVATTAFVKTAIPTKVSAFTNDSGYLTSYTETDPTVPSWAKESSKPTYTASEVGAVPTTRKVNNKALSSDITLTAADVGALASTYTAPVTSVNGSTGAVTIAVPTVASDVGAVPTSRAINGYALSSDVTLTASDVGAMPSTHTVVRLYGVTCNANSAVGDFATVNNAAITANHVVANIIFSKPNYIRSDVTWTTTDGTFTLNGRCYTATTADIILVYNDVLVS